MSREHERTAKVLVDFRFPVVESVEAPGPGIKGSTADCVGEIESNGAGKVLYLSHLSHLSHLSYHLY